MLREDCTYLSEENEQLKTTVTQQEDELNSLKVNCVCKRNATEPRLRTHHNIIWQEQFESSKNTVTELSVQVV